MRCKSIGFPLKRLTEVHHHALGDARNLSRIYLGVLLLAEIAPMASMLRDLAKWQNLIDNLRVDFRAGLTEADTRLIWPPAGRHWATNARLTSFHHTHRDAINVSADFTVS